MTINGSMRKISVVMEQVCVFAYGVVTQIHTCDETTTHTHKWVYVNLMESMDCVNVNFLVLYKMLSREMKGTYDLSVIFLQLSVNPYFKIKSKKKKGL